MIKKVFLPIVILTTLLFVAKILVGSDPMEISVDRSNYEIDQNEHILAEGTRYLSFQIFTGGPGFSTVPGAIIIDSVSMKRIESTVKDIVDAIGTTGTLEQKLAFSVGPLTLDMSDEMISEIITESFRIAHDYDVAVSFHIDDSKFWSTRYDLLSNPKNVEWLDWEGTPSKSVYLNWGEPWEIAPQMCFNAPEIVAEVERFATLIGSSISTEVKNLDSIGQSNLYAGTIVGWETAMNPEFSDVTKHPGYCALTNLGYSKHNPPADKNAMLEQVVVDWQELWSGTLVKAGLNKEMLYTHITFKPESINGELKDYGDGSLYVTPDSAFGKSHQPGFTLYARRASFEHAYEALAKNNWPRWSMSEGANVNIYEPPINGPEPEGTEAYLARFFNYGASLVNVFGWGVGKRNNPFQIAAENTDAIAAYRKFLNGEDLVGIQLEESYGHHPDSLPTRGEALHEKIQNYEKNGGDMSLIEPKAKELELYIEKKDLKNIERMITEIEKIVE